MSLSIFHTPIRPMRQAVKDIMLSYTWDHKSNTEKGNLIKLCRDSDLDPYALRAQAWGVSRSEAKKRIILDMYSGPFQERQVANVHG